MRWALASRSTSVQHEPCLARHMCPPAARSCCRCHAGRRYIVGERCTPARTPHATGQCGGGPRASCGCHRTTSPRANPPLAPPPGQRWVRWVVTRWALASRSTCSGRGLGGIEGDWEGTGGGMEGWLMGIGRGLERIEGCGNGQNGLDHGDATVRSLAAQATAYARWSAATTASASRLKAPGGCCCASRLDALPLLPRLLRAGRQVAAAATAPASRLRGAATREQCRGGRRIRGPGDQRRRSCGHIGGRQRRAQSAFGNKPSIGVRMALFCGVKNNELVAPIAAMDAGRPGSAPGASRAPPAPGLVRRRQRNISLKLRPSIVHLFNYLRTWPDLENYCGTANLRVAPSFLHLFAFPQSVSLSTAGSDPREICASFFLTTHGDSGFWRQFFYKRPTPVFFGTPYCTSCRPTADLQWSVSWLWATWSRRYLGETALLSAYISL
eukprot:gene7158-biopygen12017